MSSLGMDSRLGKFAQAPTFCPACRLPNGGVPAWVVTLSGPDLCINPQCTTGRRNPVLNARTGIVVEMVGDV